MPHSYPLRAGFGLLALVVGACTTVPPGPLPEDHPANTRAPAAPVQTEPSALSAYRDFAAMSKQPDAKAPATDHSMHKQHQQGASPTGQGDQGEPHADHQ